MKHSFYSRIRDDDKTQIMIYKKYYKFYKKKTITVDTLARLSYS